MSLIERAFRLLKEIPNLVIGENKNEPHKNKRSFLKEAENFHQTAIYPIVEENIPDEESIKASKELTETEIEAVVDKEEFLLINESDEIYIENEDNIDDEAEDDYLIDLDKIEDDVNQTKTKIELVDDIIDDNEILEDWENDALRDEEVGYIPKEEIHILNDSSESKDNSDNYFVLVETTKEILKSNSYDDFFANLMYSIIGQVGIERILIYSSRNGNFNELELIAKEGSEEEIDKIFSSSDKIYQSLENSEKILKISEIENLNQDELELVEKFHIEILIPIKVDDKFSGFILASKKHAQDEFLDSEIDFIKNLVDISSNYLSKLLDFENLNREVSELNKVLLSNNRVTAFADKIYSSLNLEEVFDLTSEFFINDFKIQKFSLLILESFSDKFKIFETNTFSQLVKEKFSLNKDSKIITMVSQISAIYKLDNPEENNELAILNSQLIDYEFIMIPLLNRKRLYGIFVVHDVGLNLTPGFKQALVSISNIIAPIISNILIEKEKNTLYKDPFNPLHSILEKEIAEAKETDSSFTLIVVKILNISRIFTILGMNFYTEYIEFISKTIQSNVDEKDYISRIGQGKFAILLKGFDSIDAEGFIEKIKSKIVMFHNPSKEFKLSIQVYSLEFPKQASDKRKFIEMLEET